MPTITSVISYHDFKKLCIERAKAASVRIMDVSMRMLRNTLMQKVNTSEKNAEALDVIFASLKDKCKNKENKKKRGLVELDDIAEWLIGPTEGAKAQVDGVYGVRRLLQRVVVKNKTYYLVDWEPTLEPATNITKDLVALFYRERRALVRKTFIEDEAVEDNSLNDASNA